ncbi:Hypothetical protein POVR2_LOCUS57 [uncultured virus]|nr:Hypothetical protein POVR2_LOCUS57 [uncultured virus]
MSESHLVNLARQGSPKELQCVLDSLKGKLADSTSEQLFTTAATSGRLDNLHILANSKGLLRDEGDAWLLVSAFEAAVLNNQAECAQFLADRYEAITSGAMLDEIGGDTDFITAAVHTCNADVLRLLDSETILDITDTEMLSLALERDDTAIFEVFRAEDRTLSSYLSMLVTSNSSKLVKLALEDNELTVDDLDVAAREYMDRYWTEIGTEGIKALLLDRRAIEAIQTVLGELSRYAECDERTELLFFIAKLPMDNLLDN